jgi:hypothetical protein
MKPISQELKNAGYSKLKPMPFVNMKKVQYLKEGDKALSTKMPFNELEFLKENIEINKSVIKNCDNVEIYPITQKDAPDPMKRMNKAQPGAPTVGFLFE